MSDIIIKAENLGKSYIIGHQAESGRYMALRDVLMQNARSLWHKTKDLVLGKPIILGDTQEEVWALKDVNFDIRRGEAVGIIGRNGAGKSTLLKVLSRITEPSAGRVTIRGRVASLLEVGTGFHPELTGRENIYLNGAILGMTRAEIKRKFDEIVAFAEVEKFLDTPVKRYSSGMYVRLAFAVAAHLEPEILVVDEVLAVGDAEFQKKCLGKMGEVAEQGRTVLFVSHNMGAIQRLCTRSIWLQKGEMRADSDTPSVLEKYLNSIGAFEGGESIASLPRRPGMGEKARYIECYTVNEDEKRSDVFRFGETIRVQLGLQVFQNISSLSLVVGIDSSMDYRITTILSEDGSALFDATTAQPLKVQMTPDVRLKPGFYYISLSIRKDKRPLDHVLKAFKFEVTNVTNDGKIQDAHVLGDIYTQAEWRQTP